ncbi:putative Ufm1-specific protease [Canna indica]|uniref:Probable Ufm1-specific protease n=1 Tax=Canna indica TaxID=4628 RepID=A0AAQ3QKE9_9LILI|nr:putative Ufm1-specific protease [Canna indica]
MEGGTARCVRVLCSQKSLLSYKSPSLRWLIGSPLFLPPFSIISSFRCLHVLPDGDPYSPDFSREADEIRMLLLRGFDIIGALFICDGNREKGAQKAIEVSRKMRNVLFGDGDHDLIGAAADLITDNIHYFVSHSKNLERTEEVSTVVYEDNPEKYVWEKACLLRCELEFKLPIFIPQDKTSDVAEIVSLSIDAAAAKLRNPHVAYLVEGCISSEELPRSIIVHGMELDSNPDHSVSTFVKTSAKDLACSHFLSKDKIISLSTIRENADAIQIAVLFNQSRTNHESAVPIAAYFPATEHARYLNCSFKLDVLCYASQDFTIAAALSKLILPGLVDQLNSIKKAATPELLLQQPQFCPYHFLPPGLLHPITAVYDLRYGETEMKQGEMRKSLHSRLGLPLDRPLLRIANALNFDMKSMKEIRTVKYGHPLLKDVHTEIPSSGVSGGIISLIDGSYEYYHYLLHGIDDNGWGCAYRSLQTIISWYRLQQYTSLEVPSHREIQQALVDIGDKEHSFVGSREWIGAIELSYVLDKLLGVSCKIINVRSGEELPEKCRELSKHFETQGTPVMIGGGVLAYTLLGVDYNEASGDCAFLILDPHYTGNDDLKKIVNGGWCGWKKAVDSKGRNFFLKDKFYNLLLPQRPNMV